MAPHASGRDHATATQSTTARAHHKYSLLPRDIQDFFPFIFPTNALTVLDFILHYPFLTRFPSPPSHVNVVLF